jgi:hypothetical protein
MLKFFAQPITLMLSVLALLLTLAWQGNAYTGTNEATIGVISPPSVLATAPSPPYLQPAILNGQPIQVLYITRSEDTVLVRCYPGYEPTLSVRTMGNNPEGTGQQEGVLTCTSSES